MELPSRGVSNECALTKMRKLQQILLSSEQKFATQDSRKSFEIQNVALLLKIEKG